MMIDDYKETILHELEKARNEREVEQIINRSIEEFSQDDLYKHLVIIFLHVLQSGLEHVTIEKVNTARTQNIQHALNYLKELNENRIKEGE
jgi:hypothetical protein